MVLQDGMLAVTIIVILVAEDGKEKEIEVASRGSYSGNI